MKRTGKKWILLLIPLLLLIWVVCAFLTFCIKPDDTQTEQQSTANQTSYTYWFQEPEESRVDDNQQNGVYLYENSAAAP